MLIALGLPVMIGVAGLGAEAGIWYYHKQRLQSAADLVASSLVARSGTGAVQDELDELLSSILRFNKLDISRDSIEVTRSDPDKDPVFIDEETVNVKITQTIPRLLTGFFQPGEVTIEGKASAQVTVATEGCILATRPNAEGLRLENNANVQVIGCEALSNDDTFIVRSGSRLTADCARSRSFVSNLGILNVTCRNGVPQEQAGMTLDPYADLPDLDLSLYSSCSVTNETVTITAGNQLTDQKIVPRFTASNGRVYVKFCNNAKLKIAAGTLVNVGNWIYIFDKSDLIVENTPGLRLLSGPTTTFYFAEGGRPIINAPNATVTLRGLAFASGMLFRGARTNTLPTGVQNEIIVGPGSNLQGAIYFPASDVRFQASGPVSNCLQIIGGAVHLNQGTWQMAGPCDIANLLRPIVASRTVRLTQ